MTEQDNLEKKNKENKKKEKVFFFPFSKKL